VFTGDESACCTLLPLSRAHMLEFAGDRQTLQTDLMHEPLRGGLNGSVNVVCWHNSIAREHSPLGKISVTNLRPPAFGDAFVAVLLLTLWCLEVREVRSFLDSSAGTRAGTPALAACLRRS
jgi:hypothetical protein